MNKKNKIVALTTITLLCGGLSGSSFAETRVVNDDEVLLKTFKGEADHSLKRFDREISSGGYMFGDLNFSGHSYTRYRVVAGPDNKVMTDVKASSDIDSVTGSNGQRRGCPTDGLSVTLVVDSETPFELGAPCSKNLELGISKDFSFFYEPPEIGFGPICFDPFFCSARLDRFTIKSVINAEITASLGASFGSQGANGSLEDFIFVHVTPVVKGNAQGVGRAVIDWWAPKWEFIAEGIVNLDKLRSESKLEFGLRHKTELSAAVSDTASKAIAELAKLGTQVVDPFIPGIFAPIVSAGAAIVNNAADTAADSAADIAISLIENGVGSGSESGSTDIDSIFSPLRTISDIQRDMSDDGVNTVLRALPFQIFGRLSSNYSVTAGSGSLSTRKRFSLWGKPIYEFPIFHLTIPPLVNIPPTPLIEKELVLWD
ncbi:hypothetical protein [Veronia pacifica]|uniref:Uncharacterized protein n=1 Tax=Veronia pacifica TaxID=1080227 RepID=A0A1C3E967_9GAMM|nr:hypothetical protein [Veronia pacifica]ODA29818.1 hypothetical protein A8L45_21715 [Veronia pacifica]